MDYCILRITYALHMHAEHCLHIYMIILLGYVGRGICLNYCSINAKSKEHFHGGQKQPIAAPRPESTNYVTSNAVYHYQDVVPQGINYQQ